MSDKTKPEDRQEDIKAKIRKYGKNWKEHITSGVIKNKPKGSTISTTSKWITKKEKPKSWITKKEKPKSWITKKSPNNPKLKGGYDPDKQQDPKTWEKLKKPEEYKAGGRTGLKHGGSVGAAKRGHGAEIK